AINYLEAHIKEIEIALQDNAAKKQDAAARLEQGREQVNQLMQAASKANAGYKHV
ncbi:MAG: prefoldin subunit alpha, partial [Nitrosopumilus sp.]